MTSIFKLMILFTISTNAFALKYMCQKAVRGNSGKYKSVKNQSNSQKKGTLNTQRSGLISTLDKAISEIEKAGCPLDNPEVKKVLDPIKNLKTEISGATAQTAPKKENTTSTQAPSAAPVPTVSPSVANTNTNTGNSPMKLSYPCRQVLKDKVESQKHLNENFAH